MTEGPETQNPKLLQPPISHGGLADSLLVKNCWDPQSSRRVQLFPWEAIFAEAAIPKL